MPRGISSAFKSLAMDGRIGKGDVQKLVTEALDGKGVTKTEAAKLKQLRAKHADLFTAKGAEAFDNFMSKMGRSWSRTKQVHLPNVDKAEVKRLLDADPRISIYTGRGGGGGEASTVRSRGGEASTVRSRGGEASTVRTAPRRSSGGEASTVRTAPRRSSGGESSSSYSRGRSSWGSSYSSGYSRSYGGE